MKEIKTVEQAQEMLAKVRQAAEKEVQRHDLVDKVAYLINVLAFPLILPDGERMEAREMRGWRGALETTAGYTVTVDEQTVYEYRFHSSGPKIIEFHAGEWVEILVSEWETKQGEELSLQGNTELQKTLAEIERYVPLAEVGCGVD